jgi:O-antigen/teichoic acid export membrane protein
MSKNIIYNLLGQGLLLILSFISIKYIFNRLGSDALGIIQFTVMLNTMIISVIEMGISSVTVREVSAYFKLEREYIKCLIQTFSLFYWTMCVLVGIMIFFLSPIIVENWISLKTMDPTMAINILRVLGITSLLGLPQSLYSSLLRGLQRMEFNNIIDVSITGIQQLGTIFIIVRGNTLLHVIYWFAACYILKIILYLIISIHFFTLKAMLPVYSALVVKRNLGFSLRMMVISITVFLNWQIDKVIISKFFPISVIGYYSPAYSAVSKGAVVSYAIAQAAFPSFSNLFKAGDRIKLISQYRNVQDFLCFVLAPIFAGIQFAALPLFSYLFNDDIAKLLLLPTTMLCIGFYMSGTLAVPYVFSLAVGKPGIAARQNLYALFVVIPISFLLIYYHGLTGAGLSYVFYNVFAYLYSIPRTCRECLEIRWQEWYLHIARIFALVGITYGVAWIILVIFDNYSSFSIAWAYIVATIVFLIASYFVISVELRKVILKRFRTLKSHFI